VRHTSTTYAAKRAPAPSKPHCSPELRPALVQQLRQRWRSRHERTRGHARSGSAPGRWRSGHVPLASTTVDVGRLGRCSSPRADSCRTCSRFARPTWILEEAPMARRRRYRHRNPVLSGTEMGLLVAGGVVLLGGAVYLLVSSGTAAAATAPATGSGTTALGSGGSTTALGPSASAAGSPTSSLPPATIDPTSPPGAGVLGPAGMVGPAGVQTSP
jgi:hypothetical protein